MPSLEAMTNSFPTSNEPTSGGPMSVVNPNQPRTQLRRAVYIHVSDLISSYNIDHAKLDEELTRVKAEMDNPQPERPSVRTHLGVPTELETSYKKRLQPPRGGNNMVALVGNIRTVVDKHRVDGSRVRLAEVEIGDETGTVSLRARDDQIDLLIDIASRSGAVVLRNCTLEIYQGKHIRLAITKWGKLSPYPDQVPSTPPPPSKINRDRNFSKINISLVASEMPSSQQQQQQSDAPFSDADSTSQQGLSSVANRSYQSNQSRRGRRPSRGRPNPGPNMPVNPYAEALPNTMRPYQGGTMQHGYHGFVAETVSVPPQYYSPRRQETSRPSVQPQQVLFQHHAFDLQQRQMQMYHGSAPHDHHQMRPLQQPPHMHVSGIPSATSFDTGYSTGSEIPHAPLHASHTFMVPISNEAAGLHSNRPDSPSKMNPQAATFDPATSNYHHYQSY